MTRAVLYRDEEHGWTGFRVKGHAGYAEEGEDIVCAAISILTVTCVNALESLCGIRAVTREDDGFLSAALPDGQIPPQRLHDAQILFGALRQGFADLAESYPRYFTLDIQERRNSR